MKVIVSESLKYNANYIIPSEQNSCSGLMHHFFYQDVPDTDFGRQCTAARFIFDEVEKFTPNREDFSEITDFVVRSIKSVGTVDKQDKPRTLEQLVDGIVKEDYCDWKKSEITQVVETLLPSVTKKDPQIVLSPDAFVNSNFMRHQHRLSDEVTLLLLACSGIDLVLPSIYINDPEQIEKFKQKFAEERLDYLLYLKQFLSSVTSEFDTRQPDLNDIYEVAYREFRLDIKLKADRINACTQKVNDRAFAYMKDEAIEKAPTIGAAFLTGNFVGAGKAIFNVLFAALKARRDTKDLLKKYQEAAYIYHMKKLDGRT